MSERITTLAQRRSALRAHCAIQRAELARNVDLIEAKLGSVDRGLNILRRYAAKPVLLIGAAALLLIVGPRRLFRWAGSGAMFITAGSRILRMLR